MPDLGADVVSDLGTGFGSAENIALLRQCELAKRTILLRILLTELDAKAPADKAASALPEALDLLRRGPADELLLYPNVGVWLVHCLRRLARPAADATPLWADLAYLGWLAATQLVECRRAGALTVVVRDGVVMLPRLGLARIGDPGLHCVAKLDHRDGLIEISSADRTVTVPDTGAELDGRWLPLRLLGRTRTTGHPVFLDDLDPFRDFFDPYFASRLAGGPPRLSAAQAGVWQEQFSVAMDLLHSDYRGYAGAIDHGLRAVVPLSAEPEPVGMSNTSFDAFGGVNMSAAAGPQQFALSLIHEFQHAKLGVLADQVPLHEPVPRDDLYAPWRDDPRPLNGLLQGIYAHLGVTDFWRVNRRDSARGTLLAHVEFARWRTQVGRALDEARTSPLLTESGRRFVDAMTTATLGWDEPVPDAADRLADESAAAHHVFWRVRNMRVADDDVAALRDRWQAGQPAGPLPPSALATPSIDYRSRLLPGYLRLFGASAGQPPPADAAYAEGDLDTALSLYEQELTQDPWCPQPWAGIALCLRGDAPLWPLLDRAEVVASLYHALDGRCDLPRLVAWLAEG
ncbi:HEXXH motif domain-containing protein [Asanoa ishikariensis]|uniref:HEXXH motif-containing protein n=1 Tax=Asanoa ishikariensis TaxID=137265 RepID=A0A1H3TNH2_9ACTN|nr:HEXXH motif domain-containing protein [Asanoa ishikariensis]GIF62075.1 HEXXH motif domain-containing protein [Asanoa ishikariensis]SDZ51822.1 HEXXH motif-containing protein [Asanoa ishikariensis]